MTELVPFQEKRGKLFPPGTTPTEAVTAEVQPYLKKIAPDLVFDVETPLVFNNENMVLGQFELLVIPSLENIATILTPVVSPGIVTNEQLPWTLARLELPVILLRKLAIAIGTKETLDVLPKPYRKAIKKLYTNKTTQVHLAEFLQSAKRSKRYLRIMQKRLGIYKERKPPFKAVQSQTNH
ncbi:hypothetical protein IT418_01350 [bacterium]|nr:hypothetical protein [bacterium]